MLGSGLDEDWRFGESELGPRCPDVEGFRVSGLVCVGDTSQDCLSERALQSCSFSRRLYSGASQLLYLVPLLSVVQQGFHIMRWSMPWCWYWYISCMLLVCGAGMVR